MSSPAQEAHDPSFPEPSPEPTPKTFWSRVGGAVVLAALFTLLVFLVGSTADLFLLKEHETPRITIEFSDAISAGVIGLLAYKLLRFHQDSRDRLRQRVETIANMNHHVRNALQVISLTSHGRDKEEIAAIRESVNRIQWALREILPKI